VLDRGCFCGVDLPPLPSGAPHFSGVIRRVLRVGPFLPCAEPLCSRSILGTFPPQTRFAVTSGYRVPLYFSASGPWCLSLLKRTPWPLAASSLLPSLGACLFFLPLSLKAFDHHRWPIRVPGLSDFAVQHLFLPGQNHKSWSLIYLCSLTFLFFLLPPLPLFFILFYPFIPLPVHIEQG